MRRFWSAVIPMSHSVQLLGISNAIVDVLAHVEDTFLEDIGAVPGSMVLIDKEQARELYAKMGPATEMSGGSVANTVAGFANLGGTAAYIGKVKADQLGTIFNHDMRSLGVDIRLKAAADGAPTARSHVLITADGQRTMQTYLGACLELLVFNIRLLRRFARVVHGGRGHGKYRLTDILNEPVCENGVIGNNRAVVVLARNVAGTADIDDTRRIENPRQVDANDSCMWLLAHADGEMQQVSRLRQIIGVRRCTRYMQVRAIVWQRLTHNMHRFCGLINAGVHRCTPLSRHSLAFHGKNAAANSGQHASGYLPMPACHLSE